MHLCRFGEPRVPSSAFELDSSTYLILQAIRRAAFDVRKLEAGTACAVSSMRHCALFEMPRRFNSHGYLSMPPLAGTITSRSNILYLNGEFRHRLRSGSCSQLFEFKPTAIQLQSNGQHDSDVLNRMPSSHWDA